MLIAEPKKPLQKMYVFLDSSTFQQDEFSHIFPRPLGGGVIIGGVHIDHDWSEDLDLSRSDRIKQRACELCPELGKPGDLQVIRHNVGLRRKFP
jgi:D-amino-acid oxidase